MSLSKKDWEHVARFRELVDGNLNPETLWIVKDMERLKIFRKMKSWPGFDEEEKRVAAHEKRILKAVWELDGDFLNDLWKAVEHFKSGGGLRARAHPKAAVVTLAWSLLDDETGHPTAKKLLEFVTGMLQPGLQMDIRTLRDICSRKKLPLAKDKVGAPTKTRKSKKITS